MRGVLLRWPFCRILSYFRGFGLLVVGYKCRMAFGGGVGRFLYLELRCR